LINTNKIIPLRGGVNFAPVKPLQQLGQREATSHYVCDAIRERFLHYSKLEEPTRREFIASGELLAKFIQGDQILERNPFNDAWMVIKPKRKDGSVARALNFTQSFVSRVLEKLLNSNPDITVRPNSDHEQDRMTAKGCEVIVNHYEQLWYTGERCVKEELGRIVWGNVIHRIRHDANEQGVQVLREIVDEVPVQLGAGAGYCGACGYAGDGQEFMAGMEETGEYACPKCGDSAVNVEPPAVEMMPSVVGTEMVNLGEFVLDRLEVPACWWDLRVTPEESAWFIHQQRASLAQVRAILGQVKLSEAEGDLGLDSIDRLAYLGVASNGKATATGNSWVNKEQVNISEMWLPVEDLLDIRLKGDEQTVGGQALPTGQTLGDIFPNGCVAVGVNGFKHLIGLYDESHKDHISSSPFFMRPQSGMGRGAVDVVEPQRRFNQLDSQMMDYMDSAATPATIYDPAIIQADDMEYIGKAKANIPASLRLLPEGRSLSDAIHQLSPSNAPGTMLQYTQLFLTKAMSTVSHANEVSQGGMVDQGDRTAREAMIVDANANSIFSPMLLGKAAQRQRNALLLLPLYRNHFPIERRFPLAGKFGRSQGVAVSGADLAGQVHFEITKDSQLPENTVTKQYRLAQFFELFQGIPNYLMVKQQAPEMVSVMERQFNVVTDERGYDAVATVCERRMDALREIAGIGGADFATLQAALDSPMNPEADAIIQMAMQQINQLMQPPIIPEEPEHQQKMFWLASWLDEDEGQEAEPPLRLLVRLLIRQHMQMDTLQKGAFAMQSAGLQAIAQPPQPEEGEDGEEEDQPPQDSAMAA
jgi:hypothetical protein